MNYRGFVIEQQFLYCDPYTKVPNGLFDGMWYHEDWETARGIYRQTLSYVKREIDNYIYEHTEYRIHRRTPKSNTITKFFYLEDAITFCESVGESISNIRVFNRGEEVAFDAI